MREVYISVDVEAAGPVPSELQHAFAWRSGCGRSQETFYIELKPVNDNFVPDAMKVVGRTLQDFSAAGRDPKEAMTAFRDWLVVVAKAESLYSWGSTPRSIGRLLISTFIIIWARIPSDSAASTSSPITWA